MPKEHDEDCTCRECLLACGDIEPDAVECDECGYIGGHHFTCGRLRTQFFERMGP